MKVGYLYEYNFSSVNEQSGSRIHARQLIAHLARSGVQVNTFSNDPIPSSTVYPFDHKAVHDFLKNSDIIYLRIDGHFLSTNKFYRTIIEKAAEMSKPIMWQIHASAEEKWWFVESGRRISRWVWQRKIQQEERCRRKYARQAHGAICVSEALRMYAVTGLGMSRSFVLPNGSDPHLFTPEKKDHNLYADYKDYFKVIYAGSAYPWQGYSYIGTLAEMARRKGQRIAFIVLNNIAKKSDCTHAGQNLWFLNRIDYSLVPSYIASADAGLCLYQSFSKFRWGFSESPLKLFDYMASARPIIASNKGQIARIIEHGRDGLLTDNEINDIYAKIVYCMEHRERAQAMGQRARKKVLRFYNWGRIAAQTVRIFDMVMKKRCIVPQERSRLHEDRVYC